MTSVLVVDDSALDRKLAGGLLEKQLQTAVLYASDGHDALRQLERHVPEATDADDGHLVSRLHIELNKWIEHGDPPAEKRAGRFQIDPVRHHDHAGCVGPDFVGKSTVATNVALALAAEAPGVPVYAVEPEGYDDTTRSLAAGSRLTLDDLHAQLLAGGRIDIVMFGLLREEWLARGGAGGGAPS